MTLNKRSTVTHLLAAVLTPVIFACAHAETGAVDGLASMQDPGSALTEPVAMEGFELGQTLPEASVQQIAAAQKKINKSGKHHKKISSPFQEPKSVSRKPAAAPVAVAMRPRPNPSVEAEPVMRNGSKLNRYYFLRRGDTPESVSTLFYGSSDRAAELVEWNGPASTWEAGKVLYYRSGKNSADNTLTSYYSEAGIETETIALEPGDTLETYASQHFGAAGSWKELAVLNGLREGMVPAAGVPLKAYPYPLVKETPVVAQMVPAPMAKEKQTKEAGSSIAGFIQHNPLIVACSIVAGVLLTFFFFMQRRRYRRFDF